MSLFALGFLAALALLAALAALRLRRWRRRRGAGGRFLLRRLFRRLATRPDQEQALQAEADALALELRALREDGRALGDELAQLLAASPFDPARLDAALDAGTRRLGAVRARVAEAFARLHGVLDEGQRRALSELLRRRSPWMHAGHGRGC
jgi:uncharacterized membrane protein